MRHPRKRSHYANMSYCLGCINRTSKYAQSSKRTRENNVHWTIVNISVRCFFFMNKLEHVSLGALAWLSFIMQSREPEAIYTPLKWRRRSVVWVTERVMSRFHYIFFFFFLRRRPLADDVAGIVDGRHCPARENCPHFSSDSTKGAEFGLSAFPWFLWAARAKSWNGWDSFETILFSFVFLTWEFHLPRDLSFM